MNNPRHQFAVQAVALPTNLSGTLEEAIGFERIGNWFLAAETYISLHDNMPGSDTIDHAKILARAASCLEFGGDGRSAARNYDRAARIISGIGRDSQLAAEIYNRAALQYREGQEYFFSGSAWTRAAEEFEKTPGNIIHCSENLQPLPISGLKSHVCGNCFEAAADVYKLAFGNEVWTVGAYWRAGRAYAQGMPNVQAFWAYRRALLAAIKYYNTLELDQLRRFLPLSDDERSKLVNPLEIMEAALSRLQGHTLQHQQIPDKRDVLIDQHRQMAATFHRLSMEFLSIGNSGEAGAFRAAQNDRQRKIALLQRRYPSATFYYLWKVTSNYGESITRWALSCLSVIAGFAVLYWALGAIAPASGTAPPLNAFDAVYFSVVTFTTLGYGDLHPIGLAGEMLSCLEVTTGFTMFGILLSFAGNRFQSA